MNNKTIIKIATLSAKTGVKKVLSQLKDPSIIIEELKSEDNLFVNNNSPGVIYGVNDDDVEKFEESLLDNGHFATKISLKKAAIFVLKGYETEDGGYEEPWDFEHWTSDDMDTDTELEFFE